MSRMQFGALRIFFQKLTIAFNFPFTDFVSDSLEKVKYNLFSFWCVFWGFPLDICVSNGRIFHTRGIYRSILLDCMLTCSQEDDLESIHLVICLRF